MEESLPRLVGGFGERHYEINGNKEFLPNIQKSRIQNLL
jgi:hypothetical protein